MYNDHQHAKRNVVSDGSPVKVQDPYNQGDKQNKQSIEFSKIDAFQLKNTDENFYKLNSINSGDQLYNIFGTDFRPISSGYPTRSHIPVAHNYVIEFDDTTQVNSIL